GALNAILQLDPAARASGVIPASAGNHGQGVAFAAKLVGVPACVVLPHGVPIAKLVAIQRTGAETVLADGGYEGAHESALRIAAERGMRYVPAFDDDDVIAGQGTVALEVLEDADVDTIVVPVGGGGLVAGIAVAIADHTPRPRIVCVQADGASAFAASFEQGRVVERDAATIADGIAVRRPASRTLRIASPVLYDIITVSDRATAPAATRSSRSFVRAVSSPKNCSTLRRTPDERIADDRSGPLMPKTLAEKIYDAHVVSSDEDRDLLYIDLHLVHEVTSPQAFE